MVKLMMLGRKLNFINFMFVNQFLYQNILGGCMIWNFLLIGKLSWTDDDVDGDDGTIQSVLMSPCGLW